LRINQENGKSQAAWLKIIKKHFSGANINLEPFLNMGMKVLPYAVEWVGRDNGTAANDEGFNLLYQLCRGVIKELL